MAETADIGGIDLSSEAPFRLGVARIDPVSHEASFNGSTERLQPQNLKVLVALAQKRRLVVTREELIRRCWDGRFIGDDVINRAISNLRQFAERAGGFEIETVPRLGYRVVETTSRPLLPRRMSIVFAMVIVAAAAALAATWMHRARAASDEKMTVAVLPFATGSSDPVVRKLAFDARDSVGHALSQSRLSVTLPNSQRAQTSAVSPDFLISADVSDAGDQVQVTMRMTKATDHTVVYSQIFEDRRGNAAALAQRIGPQVAGWIGWTTPLLIIDRAHPSDPRVLRELFREVGTMDEPLSGYERNKRVAADAPNSAIAQLSLAFTVEGVLPALPREDRPEAVAVGRRAQEAARRLSPTDGEAFIPFCTLRPKVPIIACEDNLRLARKTDPNSPWVDFYLGEQLLDVGRYNEAFELAQRSLGDDPYAPGKINFALRSIGATGGTVEGAPLLSDVENWWPKDVNWIPSSVSGMIDGGDFEGIRRFEHEIAPFISNDYPLATPIVNGAMVHDLAGTKRVCGRQQPESLNAILCVLVLARLGDFNTAFAYADRIYPRRVGKTRAEEERIWLDKPFVSGTEYLVGKGAAALRTDPRYLALADRVGLLAYWRSGRLPDFCRPPQPEPICNALRQ